MKELNFNEEVQQVFRSEQYAVLNSIWGAEDIIVFQEQMAEEDNK